MSPKQLVLVSLVAISFVPGVAFGAQGHGRGHDSGRRASARHEPVVVTRDDHRRMVRDYYRNKALPPGLAKRESLPPGLQKQLRERGELPPGLQKRVTRVRRAPVPPSPFPLPPS